MSSTRVLVVCKERGVLAFPDGLVMLKVLSKMHSLVTFCGGVDWGVEFNLQQATQVLARVSNAGINN